MPPPRGDTDSPHPRPGSPFASACGTFRSSRTLSEFYRVAPISCALLLPEPALNQGPFPPPALPGFLSNTGLSATPPRPVCPSPAPGWSSRPTTPWASRVACVFLLCTCPRHYSGTVTGCSHRSLPQSWQPSRLGGSVGPCIVLLEDCLSRSLPLRPAHSLITLMVPITPDFA